MNTAVIVVLILAIIGCAGVTYLYGQVQYILQDFDYLQEGFEEIAETVNHNAKATAKLVEDINKELYNNDEEEPKH